MIYLAKSDPRKFDQFIREIHNKNLYQHKFLNNYLNQVIAGRKVFYEMSLVCISEKGWILILHGEVLLVYGDSWNKSYFEEISEFFNLNKFTNYGINGDSKLIFALLEFFNVTKYTIDKERILYRTQKVANYRPTDLTISMGKLEHANELAVMLQQYYHEEYHGENDKPPNEMEVRIQSVILSKTIYVLKNTADELLAFCTIINPDIGILFTKHFYRNKGYGRIMLSHCSSILKENRKEVYVMTDKENIASNIVCKAVGFEAFFDYTTIEINKTK